MLVDTNVISELARRKPDPAVTTWAAAVPLPLAVSVVTLEEIHFGLTWRPNAQVRAWFDDFFAKSCTVLPVTDAIAKRAGELRGQLRAAGRQRTHADMLVASTAQAHQLTLVTRNVRDFEGCGITVVNPFAAP
ncbi:MAG TPA: type II toxin-antitoxin system VapC family toxin [Thermoanaerobaculia bacterium]|jgi:predicted nucleic acid-binding protein|nr:type II toxin-antitoxin system VapC family toxin [Thermoanaerobaculia bacterium]